MTLQLQKEPQCTKGKGIILRMGPWPTAEH